MYDPDCNVLPCPATTALALPQSYCSLYGVSLTSFRLLRFTRDNVSSPRRGMNSVPLRYGL